MSQSGVHALSLRVDRDAPERLPAQIAAQIRDRVRSGVLAPGARLPSSRAVASSIDVSRAVASAAYDQLVAEGWLEARQGSGTYVRAVRLPARSPRTVPSQPRRGRVAPLDLRPGEPWTPSTASPAWRRAWRDVAHAAPPADYPATHGLPELRVAVAEHLSRTRGLSCTPEQVMITTGTTHGLSLMLGELHRPGAAIALEDPGYRSAAEAARLGGWTLWPARVDESGLDPAVLDDAPESVSVAYATPSHQYPLGVLMPIDRRVRLLEWARRRDAYVVEDDYDSEFR
ncbi:MAG: PLP-dependent aminotransferase family protein, partial [Actinomycetia bacterium]|nr:PLP-dependent aminotransferase family protein [Actinomycetes bacterium]